MNLNSKILADHTKANCEEIINWVGIDQKRFDELVDLFVSNDKIIAQRSGWPLSYIAIENPQLARKHIGKLLKNLKKKGIHAAVKRNTIRLLQNVTIPEKYQGDVMNICFDYIQSNVEKPAIKAFSLAVLYNLSKQYPEIQQELKTIIEDRQDFESAAFNARARHILKRL